jgi:hypothetical protein
MSPEGASAPRALATREVLLLAFFATFVVLTRAALRWHLHLPGHAMLPTALLLVLARACVDRVGAASAVGLMAGLACALLGMGRGGLVIALKLALPGVAVDATASLLPARLGSPAWGALLGAAAGASHFVPVAGVELLAGLPVAVVLAHAGLAAGAQAAFGAAGGAAGAVIAARLAHHGLLSRG